MHDDRRIRAVVAEIMMSGLDRSAKIRSLLKLRRQAKRFARILNAGAAQLKSELRMAGARRLSAAAGKVQSVIDHITATLRQFGPMDNLRGFGYQPLTAPPQGGSQ